MLKKISSLLTAIVCAFTLTFGICTVNADAGTYEVQAAGAYSSVSADLSAVTVKKPAVKSLKSSQPGEFTIKTGKVNASNFKIIYSTKKIL